MMKRLLLLNSIAAAALFAPNAVAAQPATSSGIADRDPITMAALNRMGAALRSKSNMAVRVDITAEDVLMSGQKLQFGGVIDIVAQRPNMLKMDVQIGQSDRKLFYDGEKLTLYAPKQNYYAVFDAPPTIKETVQVAADSYGLEIPLADMVAWGTDAELESRVLSAFPVGSEKIGGQMCEHHAVRGGVVDWQIWIRQSGDALPCKLVITDTLDPAMPQYVAVYNWLDNRAVDPRTFTFKAPAGASPIVFGSVRPTPGATSAKSEK